MQLVDLILLRHKELWRSLPFFVCSYLFLFFLQKNNLHETNRSVLGTEKPVWQAKSVWVCHRETPGRVGDCRNAKLSLFVLFWFGFTLEYVRFESGFRDLTLCCKVLRGSGACVLPPQVILWGSGTRVCVLYVPGSREVGESCICCCVFDSEVWEMSQSGQPQHFSHGRPRYRRERKWSWFSGRWTDWSEFLWDEQTGFQKFLKLYKSRAKTILPI